MDHKEPPFQVEDVPAAIGFLSRLPVRVNPDWAQKRGARSAWAYPLAGAAIGALSGMVGLISLWLGLGPGLSAGLALVSLVMITGGLHEDGLADTADGFWGAASPLRRLEIMKDSRIGTFGVLALVLSILLRWSALAHLFGNGQVFWVLVGAAALSRAPLPLIMQSLPNARGAGLSADQGQPGDPAVWGALGLGALLGVVSLGGGVVMSALAAAVVAFAFGRVAVAKIGGQTGDVLGAIQQVAEIAILAVLVARA